MDNREVDHFSLLFVSDIAPEAKRGAVAEIARQARANNERNDLTGLLVFDGQHFSQLVEGPEERVRSMVALMEHDPRHRNMEVLHSEPVMKARRFPSWRMGFLLLDLSEFGLASLHGQRGLPALESFNFMLPALEPAIGDAVPGQLVWGRPE